MKRGERERGRKREKRETGKERKGKVRDTKRKKREESLDYFFRLIYKFLMKFVTFAQASLILKYI